ncbi:MAG: B12-binding domain-containing radical SAM protein, partial [Gammaproteobacteria bacterium]|nr:B12-binding domain-containing radical SAM protein [Gammaproteobacteria bacterium]
IDMQYMDVPDLTKVSGLPGEFDVVAISSFTAQMNEAYQLADRYRAVGTTVLLGGLHVTALPDEALQHADAIVIGEGEPAWPALLDDLQQNRLQRIYDSRSRPFNMADSPMPRFDLLNQDHYNRMMVQTSRGCPFSCEFCAASIRLSPLYRVKPVHKVIAEVRRIKELQPKPFIEFADDNTFVNKHHGKELMQALQKEDVKWFTETDVSVAEDEDLLKLMRDAGCVQVLIGFESTTRAGLAGIELKSDWKAKRFDGYMSAVDKIQRHGISVNGCFVLGMDNDGPECFEGVVEFVRDSNLYDVQITLLTAFPGAPLYDRLKSEGRLLDETAWQLCTLFDVNFTPRHMSPQELESKFRWLVERIYNQEFTDERHRKFHERQAALLASRSHKEVYLHEHHHG